MATFSCISFDRKRINTEKKDIRLLVGSFANTMRDLRAEPVEAARPVVGLSTQSISLRIKRMEDALGAPGITSYSGRIGMVRELTRGNASINGIMRSGNWQTERMVQHYSSVVSVQTDGAVAKYLQ